MKITQAVADSIREKLKTFDFDTLEKAKKAKEDNGTFDVIISTDTVDRSGEIVKQDGWDFTNYKRNPVVLWGHDYYSLPIGVCTNISVEGNKTRAQGVFLSADINPFAQQVRKLYEFGTKNGMGVGCTTSVGFIPKDFDTTNQKIITKQELLEFSFVPIPAQADVGNAKDLREFGYGMDAIPLTIEAAEEIGLDIFAMRSKGMTIVEKKKKEAQAGDGCQMDDGTPGILANDPKNSDGPLVCVPNTQDKSADEEKDGKAGDKFMKAIDGEHTRHKGAYKKAIDAFKASITPKGEKAKEGKTDANEGDNSVDMAKCMKAFRSEMADEHDMHKSKMIECFRSFAPTDEKKSFDNGEHLKAVRDQHKAYTSNVNNELDKFEEKCSKDIAGGPNEVDNNTDWIVGKLAGHQTKHMKAIGKIAKAMCKDGFGEGETTETKAWYLKGAVEEQLIESEERQAKWKKVDAIYDIFGAFINAYLDDSTLVTDFEKLLDEAVALMKGVETKGVLSGIDRKGMATIVFRIAAEVSKETKEKLSEAHKNLKAVTAVLKDLTEGLADDDEEESHSTGMGDNIQADEGSQKSGSKPQATSTEDAELKTHLQIREIVRGIEAISRDSLAQINANIRSIRDGKKK